MSEKLVRDIIIRPAFDRRDPNPSKNYGIHGCEMAFYVKGKNGAIQFIIYTNWHLPHVQKELIEGCTGSKTKYEGCHFCLLEPMAVDIGYHSPVPHYEGQEVMRESCELLGGKPCYYDGSSLNAKRYFQILTEKGSDGLWEALEEYYNHVFTKNEQE